MAYTYQQIVDQEWQNLQNEEQHAAAALEKARIEEDDAEIDAAKNRIYWVDQKKSSLVARVQQTHPQQNGQQVTGRNVNIGDKDNPRYVALSDEEISVAKLMNPSDTKLSDGDRLRLYGANKQKLAHMRATGQYTDRAG